MKTPVPPQKPPSGSALVDISSEQDARIGVAVRYVEGMYRNRLDLQPRGPRGGGGSGPQIMFVTTAITKRVGVTCGTGFARPATFGVVGANQLDPGSATPLAVKNFHTDKGFVAGCYVAAYPWYGALWAFDVDACTNLS